MFIIRTICALSAIPYFFRSFREAEDDRSAIFFWLATTMCLPLCFGLILVQGALSQGQSEQTSIVLIVSYLTALFIYVQIQNSPLLAVAGWLISLLACSLFALSFPETSNFEEYRRVFILPVFAYLTAIFVGSLTNRNIAKIESEKLNTAKSIGYSIAHEVRTPLTTIKNRAIGLKEYLPSIVAAHKELNLIRPDNRFRPEIYDSLESSLDDISEDVDNLHAIVDILLAATKTSRIYETTTTFNVAEKVHEAVDRYPYANDYEKGLVSVHIHSDFSISAGPVQLRHVLMNLLKNALYYVQNSRGSQIEVSVDADLRCVKICDNGSGIPPGNLGKIFDPFFTTTDIHNGSGLGLTFCKLALESMGADISAENNSLGGATFTIYFSGSSSTVSDDTK